MKIELSRTIYHYFAEGGGSFMGVHLLSIIIFISWYFSVRISVRCVPNFIWWCHTKSSMGDWTATGRESISSINAGGMVRVAVSMGGSVSVTVGTFSFGFCVGMAMTPLSGNCRGRFALHRQTTTIIMITTHKEPNTPETTYNATKPAPPPEGLGWSSSAYASSIGRPEDNKC